MARGAEAHARDERSDVAGLGEEGDAGEGEGGIEDVAAALDDGVAEGGVEEVALGDAPAEPLLLPGDGGLVARVDFGVGAGGLLRRLREGVGDAVGVGALVGGWVEDIGELRRAGGLRELDAAGGEGGGRGGAAGFGFDGFRFGAEEDVLRDAVLELVAVGGEVDVVEAEDGEEVVDAVDVAVGDLGLDGVADLGAEEMLQGLGDLEGALDDGRTDDEVDVDVGAVDGVGGLQDGRAGGPGGLGVTRERV